MSAAGSVQGIASSFRASTPVANTSLIDRINGLFGSAIVYIAAGVAYGLYQVYQAYQYSLHTSYGLDDEFKAIKCLALLLEAHEKQTTENVQPLLKECESLRNSISGKKNIDAGRLKNEVQLRLASYYAKTDPELACAFAAQFASSNTIFRLAQEIQKNFPYFDAEKLQVLYAKCIERLREEMKAPVNQKYPQSDCQQALKFAKAFFSIGKIAEAASSLELANDLAMSIAKPVERIEMLRQVAQCSMEINLPDKASIYIGEMDSLTNQVEADDLIRVHLSLAEAFYSVNYFEKMDQELREVHQIFASDPSKIHANHHLFVQLISKIIKNPAAQSEFRTIDVQSLINTALDNLDLSTLAMIYKDKLVENPASEKDTIASAYARIIALPEETDQQIDNKIFLLTGLIGFYKENPAGAKSIFQQLEALYEKCPFDRSSRVCLKEDLGRRIVALYNIMPGLEEESAAFFNKQINNLMGENSITPIDKIRRLVAHWRNTPELRDSRDQAAQRLQKAEELLAQLSSNSDLKTGLALIAEGYLHINRQRSLEILRSIEDRQVRVCLINGGVTAIALGAIPFYPLAGITLSLGLLAYQVVSLS